MPSFELHAKAGRQSYGRAIDHAIIAGWTGRDAVALEKHIKELEEMGVARPATTPIYYEVSNELLTTSARIQVSGADSSGEVEFVIGRMNGAYWVGIGSDHTDRKMETIGVTFSKQMCAKPVGREFWAFDDVKDHWEQLVLRSYAVNGNDRVLYQEGSVAAMRDPMDLIRQYNSLHGDFPDGSVMFGGTFAAIGGIRFAERFEFELADPVLDRKLSHAYDVIVLPVRG